ncbi:hypothetical protein L9F63_013586, partial [Diploptera punctata]
PSSLKKLVLGRRHLLVLIYICYTFSMFFLSCPAIGIICQNLTFTLLFTTHTSL